MTLRDLDMEFPWHKTLREEEASERGPWQRKPWERGSWERERDGIAGEGPTRAIKTHPELWAQLEKIWQWAAKIEPNILTHGNFTYLGSLYYIVTPVAVTQNKNIVKHQIQSLSWYITCKMPAYILTQITASFWIRAIDAAGFWSRKIVGSEPAQARIQCCNHQEFQNVLFFVDHWPILIKKET